MTETVSTKAAIWLARIERGLQLHEGAQLRQWLTHPDHRATIVNIAKLYHGPDVVAVLAELVPVGFGNPPPPMPRRSRKFAIAAALGVAAFTILPFVAIIRAFPGHHNSGTPATRIMAQDERLYTTDAGKPRTFRLPEGSEVILNGQSQLYALNAAWAREATVSRGEAVFDITGEWPRPIDIFAGGHHFEAVSGRFDIRVISPQTVQLTVVEGGVTVKGLPFHWPTTPAEARAFDPRIFADTRVGAMQSAWVDLSGLSQHPISAADLRSQLRWEPEQVVYVTP